MLATAHAKLADRGKAQVWYDRAVRWMDENKPNNDELRRFRAEAAEVLGIKDSTTHTKAKPKQATKELK